MINFCIYQSITARRRKNVAKMGKIKFMGPYSCDGFHGTTRENADKILQSGKFKISRGSHQWLGDGVYFFVNDMKQACDFCKRARPYQDFVILKSRIEVNILLDLDDVETFNMFSAFAKRIMNRTKRKGNNNSSELSNAKIINAIYKIWPFDAVKATFRVPKRKPAPGTNIYPSQVQICVRNLECIKSIEEVFCDATYYC
jgi:hypothetical protein